jgi:hypothetical protein
VPGNRIIAGFDKNSPADRALFTDITAATGIQFKHKENSFIDFKNEYLIPYQLSRQGPKLAAGDVNDDGLDDFFVGGAKDQAGVLYQQLNNGTFIISRSQPWQKEALCEDTDALFFDVDNDGDQDLYVVSGGNEWAYPGEWLQDRLYVNDGKGGFTLADATIPKEVFNGSCVKAGDFDKDGDLDLFIGAGTIPGKYPAAAGNIVLRNDSEPAGKIVFTDITHTIAGSQLFRAGMVNDASWVDLDNDGWVDLVIAGDWMPVMVFKNDSGKQLTDVTTAWGLSQTNGFWHKLLPADIDNDGDLDLIAGNLGSNTQFRANAREPLVTYTADFNDDGKKEPIMSWYIQHKSYPFNSRDELVEQMPVLNKRFLKYDDFAKATIDVLLDPQKMNAADKTFVYNTLTGVFINNGKQFEWKPLPVEAQFSMVQAIGFKDYDGDGISDILLAGNFYPFRVQQGRSDASMGSVLRGDGKGNFKAVDRHQTGLFVKGDVRDMITLKSGVQDIVVFSRNNDSLLVIKRRDK